MNFSKTYRRMNEPVGPSPDLIRKTLSHPDRHRLPLRRLAAAAAVAAVLLATPALAVRSETGYAVLYRIAPAVAQFFQPIQEACTDSGITMEVAAVRVEGDTAQAYIVLSGGPERETLPRRTSSSPAVLWTPPQTCLTVGPSTCPLTRPAAVSGWPGTRPPGQSLFSAL